MKVLVCPLNWGLGHATRCVPIIRQLLNKGHEPIIVSDGYPLELLKITFPTLQFIELKSYSIKYSTSNTQVFAMLRNLPYIIIGIIKEHIWLKKLLKKVPIDRIISDNRFGLWNKNIESIYISHQLMVKMPSYIKFIEPIVWLLHRSIINRYNECWIPDFESFSNLSADLSHKYPLPINAKFIGPLSRFQGVDNIIPNKSYEVVALVSGIEPQRTMYENSLIHTFKNEPFKTLIICGQPQENSKNNQIGNVTLLSHINDIELTQFLLGAKKIVSRAGYSTIMDLAILNCLSKTELSATPGQTEQEYLVGRF